MTAGGDPDRAAAALERIRPSLAQARWTGLHGAAVERLEPLEAVPLDEGVLVIAEVRIAGALTPVLVSVPEDEAAVARELVRLASGGGSRQGGHGGRLVGRPGPGGAVPVPGDAPVRVVAGDQTHTSLVVGGDAIVKLYRRLDPGPGVESGMLAALAGHPEAPVPPWFGAVELELADGRSLPVAIVQGYLGDLPDAFEVLADELAAGIRTDDAEPGSAGAGRLGEGPWARGLPVAIARATAALHRVLAGLDDASARPCPATLGDRARWLADAEVRIGAATRAVASLGTAAGTAAGTDGPAIAEGLERAEPAIRRALRPLGDAAIPTMLQRIHGDLHLGQVLPTRDGEVRLIDFEGDPTVAAAARGGLDTPLRDLATLLRSLDHVARSAARRAGRDPVQPIPVVEDWLRAARGDVLDAYGRAVGGSPPVDRALLRALEVDKELAELVYAATFLPTWLYAPVGGLRALAGVSLSAVPAPTAGEGV